MLLFVPLPLSFSFFLSFGGFAHVNSTLALAKAGLF